MLPLFADLLKILLRFRRAEEPQSLERFVTQARVGLGVGRFGSARTSARALNRPTMIGRFRGRLAGLVHSGELFGASRLAESGDRAEPAASRPSPIRQSAAARRRSARSPSAFTIWSLTGSFAVVYTLSRSFEASGPPKRPRSRTAAIRTGSGPVIATRTTVSRAVGSEDCASMNTARIAGPGLSLSKAICPRIGTTFSASVFISAPSAWMRRSASGSNLSGYQSFGGGGTAGCLGHRAPALVA